MASFLSDGVQIAYDDITPAGGADRTIVLIHGFASNRVEGWKRTGWYAAFERRRTRVIALDQRGHGESAKLYEPQAYERERLAADVLNLMDELDVERADMFGYSMGTRTALELAIAQPSRLSHLILGGVGGKLLEKAPDVAGEPMADAMLAEDSSAITQPMLRSFRQFADEQGEDRKALAAVTRVKNMPFNRDALRDMPVPTLVVAGAGDEGAGDPEALARVFPHGHGVTIPGCDHFSAIPHALTKAAVFDFLDGLLGEDEFPPFE
ncbi:MAG TPA: alpha/beta hydrolase [Phenylobacterium sp.]|jgi:pimeloyl-ACP methyl ester carboxylesterase|uniref:alpha/beta fold hydrolase n=1 Tax=Phenylobacterium sp. TaxID=1871053 RepID=UPI002D192C49|nr:alpha/beta hydrolase [Phenylobacterium sp.]HXA40419.1 alpha/beta hydrolase [Phenylobacterium sp.]